MTIGKLTKLLVAPLGLVALIAIVGWWSRGQANSGGPTEIASPAQANIQDIKEKVAALNSKATLASSGDETAVRSLADAVFTQFGSAEMNDALAGMKERIVTADISYRREGTGGISESKLVNSLNEFTKELGAPDFANVSVAQLRYLRANLMTASPSLIGQSTERQSKSSALRSEMSPLEATSLTMLLVTQKLSNQDFQVTPGEWAEKRRQEQLAQWKANRGGGRADPVRRDIERSVARANTKGEELRHAFRNHAVDVGSLVDGLLTEMGVAEGRTKR